VIGGHGVVLPDREVRPTAPRSGSDRRDVARLARRCPLLSSSAMR
jgi:hypothetical protein